MDDEFLEAKRSRRRTKIIPAAASYKPMNIIDVFTLETKDEKPKMVEETFLELYQGVVDIEEDDEIPVFIEPEKPQLQLIFEVCTQEVSFVKILEVQEDQSLELAIEKLGIDMSDMVLTYLDAPVIAFFTPRELKLQQNSKLKIFQRKDYDRKKRRILPKVVEVEPEFIKLCFRVPDIDDILLQMDKHKPLEQVSMKLKEKTKAQKVKLVGPEGETLNLSKSAQEQGLEDDDLVYVLI